ncbi:MAG: alpha/beta hydrolase [Clostridia bacterium]|nr:alpha/beta hydrolase [Clostridia bacterium]
MELKKIDYFNYEAYSFTYDGLDAFIVKPSVKPNGKWVYKTEYFTAFPDIQNEFLDRGYHLLCNKNYTRWAPANEVLRKGEFIKFVSKEFGLSKKCITIGMSAGGLYACKIAEAFPELIDVLYIDAPVMNLLSCPLGLGIGKPHVIDECLDALKLTMSQMLSYRDNPIDKMDVLIKNDIPVVLVVGDSDDIVPFCENGALLEKYYNENGGKIVVYIKENCGHHPHGLEDYKGLVDQIEKFSKQ